jgi:hypothetical protein
MLNILKSLGVRVVGIILLILSPITWIGQLYFESFDCFIWWKIDILNNTDSTLLWWILVILLIPLNIVVAGMLCLISFFIQRDVKEMEADRITMHNVWYIAPLYSFVFPFYFIICGTFDI